MTAARVQTYEVSHKGRLLAVEAVVEPNRVRLFSYRVVEPRGYADERLRMQRVDIDADAPHGDSDSATAFSSWTEEDRAALATHVRAADELRTRPVGE